MTDPSERGDYILGTGDVEIERLGLQHRVWRPYVLDVWRRAGITTGSRVLDVGAGPGHATVDLAEIVGPTGEVIAVERSERFLRHARAVCRSRGLTNVHIHEQDVMTEPLPASGVDAAWCRWVACFVDSPARLVHNVARTLRPGGTAIFHEYGDYGSWRLAPRGPALAAFVTQVMASWRATGGEPDVGLELPTLLRAAGFRVRDVRPLVFTCGPRDYTWQWPAAFMHSGLQRLRDLGEVDASLADALLTELRDAEADFESFMITPLLLEITAELP